MRNKELSFIYFVLGRNKEFKGKWFFLNINIYEVDMELLFERYIIGTWNLNSIILMKLLFHLIAFLLLFKMAFMIDRIFGFYNGWPFKIMVCVVLCCYSGGRYDPLPSYVTRAYTKRRQVTNIFYVFKTKLTNITRIINIILTKILNISTSLLWFNATYWTGWTHCLICGTKLVCSHIVKITTF